MAVFYTYILFSPKFQKHYYGQTSDLKKRLEDHNNGLSTYTKKFVPWELVYYEEFTTRSEAMKRERFFKSSQGYRWLRQNKII